MHKGKAAPGPWSVTQESQHFGRTYRNLQQATVSDVGGDIVAKVEQGATVERDNATACLIASAPEMQVALEKILAAAEGSVCLKNSWVVEVCRSALEKVNG